MKNYLKPFAKKSMSLAKKSMSLFMAVMMLMTCWVFIAPESNTASAANSATNYSAAVIQAFEKFVGGDGMVGKATIEGAEIKKFFSEDSDTHLSKASSAYNNVLYSGNAKQVTGITNYTLDDSGALESAAVFYPTTVLMYDGSSNPYFGVSFRFDSKSNCNVYHWGTAITGTNLSFYNSSWYGYADGTTNPKFLDAYYQGNNSAGATTSNGSAGTDNYYKPGAGGWVWLANLIAYSGTLDDTTYHTSVTPSFKSHFSQAENCGSWKGNKTDISLGTSNTPIYIINTKVWNQAIYEAIAMYQTIQANPNRYSNVEDYKAVVQALFDCNPNDYTWSDSTVSSNLTSYKNDASAAITAWKNFKLVENTYTVNFIDEDGTTSKTVVYGNGVAASAFPAADGKDFDDDNHYTFAGWSLTENGSTFITSLSNVTSNTSVYAVYTGTAHSFTVEPPKHNGNDTHSWKCTGCEAYGTEGGKPGHSEDCIFPDAWSWDGTYHYKECSVCDNIDKHQAVWIETENYLKTAATCVTNKDTFYKECKTCGVSSKDFAPNETWEKDHVVAHARVEKIDEYVAPTCENDGKQVYWCPACGGQREEIVLKGGHVLEEKVSKDGDDVYHYWKCSVCEKTVEDGKEEHTWTLIYASPATCTENSIGYYFCGICGYEIESIYDIDKDGHLTSNLIAPALDHKNADGTSAYEFYEAGVEATCSTTGNHKEMCSLCFDIKTVTDPINPDNHKYSAAQSNGNGTHTAVCDYNAAHVITDPCEDNDNNCICDTCGYNIPHVYDKEVVADEYLATEATCTADATYYRSCQCGAFEENADNTFVDLGSVLGHDYTEESDEIRSAATCTEAQTNWYGCSRCDANAKDDAAAADKYYTVGTPLGHEATNNIISVTENTHGFKCVRYDACGEVLNITDCTFENYVNNGDGTHTATCACGNTLTEGHKLTDKWESDDPAGEQAGTHSKYCTLCDYVETNDCDYETEIFDATCLAPKRTEYTCTLCGHGYTVFEGTKLDHSYTGEYDIDAENDKHRQLCVNGCNEYGEWAACTLEYSQITGTETHTATCPDCGNVDTGACSGGSATCIKKAECDKCGGEHGDYAPHDFSGAARNEGEGKHNYNCSTPGCTEYGVGSVIGATEDCFGGTAYCDAKKVCEACNTAYGEFDLNNHKNTTAMPGKAPTCMEEGYTDYEQCDNPACNAELGKEVIPVDPDAHKWSSEAVPTNDGKHYYACEYNAEHKDYYDCFCSSPSILPPTCLEGGYTEHYCDDCNYYWTTDPTAPTGHDWGKWTTDENKTGHYRVCKNDEEHIETGVCAESATSVVTAPTCTEQGYTTYTCDLCGNVWVADYVPATGHTYTQKIIDDAHLFTAEDYEDCGITSNTCERADYYWFDCKDCDKNGKDETDTDKYPLVSRYYQNGKGEGHTWNGQSVSEYAILATPATCDKNATYYVYCTACHMSKYVVDGENAATFEAWGTAISHDYQEIVDENDLTKNRVSVATCTAKAKYYKSCANCGDVSEDTFNYGEMIAHKYTKKMSDYAHIITEATCETVATYWYNCEYCNSNAKMIEKDGMTEEEIAALQYTDGTLNPNNHGTLIRVPYKAPTCKEDGHSEYRVCSLCDKEIGKVTAGYEKKNHSFKGEYKIVNVVDADGNVTAYKHQRACEYGCGEYSTAADCGFSAWTQNADGKTHSMACVCGNKITANCEADSNASCEVAATCKDCKGVVGTVSGHDWGNWTSNGDGKTHSRVCKTNSKHVETDVCGGGVASGCGAIYCSTCNQQYATGVDHDWGEWVDTKAATCLTPAEHMRACQKCSATEEETYGTALGHDYDKDNDGINDYVVTKEATCTEAGIKTFTCLNNCGETYTEVIKALGHELAKEWTTVQEATCAAEGKQIKKCIHSWKDADGKTVECDYYEEKTIPADKSKHVPGEWIPDEGASNCVTGLKSYKYCTVCGLEVDSKTETISHDWKADGIVYGTCTANGYINMLCSKCGSRQVFDEKTPGFPNKFDDTVIDGATASKLLSKGGHKWETSTSSSADYVIQNGCVIYVTKAATCSKLGTGYMVCSADGCKETKTVSINKTEHNLKTMPASEATCQTPGHTEYLACRNCSYAEKPTTIPKLGHVDKDGSGKCDRCGFQMYAPPSGGTAACGCMCHNSSFFMAKIIYPIARFFWKLFKTNKSCSCGNVHY